MRAKSGISRWCQSFVSSWRPWTCISRYWHWTAARIGESFDVSSRIETRMKMAAEGCLIALRFHLDAFWGTAPNGYVSRVGCYISEKHLSNTQSLCPDSTESSSSHRTSSLYLLLENGRLSIQWMVGDYGFHLSAFSCTFVSAAIACITNQISPILCSRWTCTPISKCNTASMTNTMLVSVGHDEVRWVMFTSSVLADIGLEFEESERYENFKDFYSEVRPEFGKHGHVTTFKVCSNFELHLRGNVYVEYETYDH